MFSDEKVSTKDAGDDMTKQRTSKFLNINTGIEEIERIKNNASA
jgi:hypothetical protein